MIPTKGEMTRRDMIQLASGLIALPVLSACGADKGDATQTDLVASDLAELISEIAERIIPQTDTPGAKAAGVPQFIQMLMSDWYAPEDRGAFTEALKMFDTIARKAGHKTFVSADEAAQKNILARMEKGLDDIGRSAHSAAAKSAFEEMKQLTVWAYYTSEAAAEELNFDPIPGRHDGCADLADAGRAHLITGI